MLLQRRTARIWSKACAVLGLGAFIIHAAFALVGRHEFALPLSMLSIVACVYEERMHVNISAGMQGCILYLYFYH